MKKIIKLIAFAVGVKFILQLLDENIDVKEQVTKLRNELAKIETKDLEVKIKDFFKRYDPNFKDQEDI
jgi:hypothetical protein